MYKLIIIIVTEKLYAHVTTNLILPFEQKIVWQNARGWKYHLLLDKEVTEDTKKRKRNVSFVWISHKKAYDGVPHAWPIKAFKINTANKTMPLWSMKIYIPYENRMAETYDIPIKIGIF